MLFKIKYFNIELSRYDYDIVCGKDELIKRLDELLSDPKKYSLKSIQKI